MNRIRFPAVPSAVFVPVKLVNPPVLVTKLANVSALFPPLVVELRVVWPLATVSAPIVSVEPVAFPKKLNVAPLRVTVAESLTRLATLVAALSRLNVAP